MGAFGTKSLSEQNGQQTEGLAESHPSKSLDEVKTKKKRELPLSTLEALACPFYTISSAHAIAQAFTELTLSYRITLNRQISSVFRTN